VGLSRSALHERFAQFTGHAPMQYLANWRMQLAANLLRQSGSSIASIALDVGYQSEAAFSRAFRRAVGAPPAAWRRQQAKA
jgi:AraC-like DNA-binding protein